MLARVKKIRADRATPRAVRHAVTSDEHVPVHAVQRLASLDSASQARLLATLQRQYGNAAVQRLVAQRDQVFHDTRAALDWKDFKGRASAKSPFDAGTQSGHTSLGWKATAKRTGKVWDAEAEIDPASLNLRAFMERGKSWVRKARTSADLLRHEQGHFDIEHVLTEKGEVAIRAAAAGVKATASHRQPRKAVKAAIDQLKASAPFVKLASMETVISRAQQDYDEDPKTGTGHGTKPAEQAQWEADIKADLPGYPIP